MTRSKPCFFNEKRVYKWEEEVEVEELLKKAEEVSKSTKTNIEVKISISNTNPSYEDSIFKFENDK